MLVDFYLYSILRMIAKQQFFTLHRIGQRSSGEWADSGIIFLFGRHCWVVQLVAVCKILWSHNTLNSIWGSKKHCFQLFFLVFVELLNFVAVCWHDPSLSELIGSSSPAEMQTSYMCNREITAPIHALPAPAPHRGNGIRFKFRHLILRDEWPDFSSSTSLLQS